MIVSASDHWTVHAEQALEQQQIPVTRLRVQELAASPIDWSKFTLEQPEDMRLNEKQALRPHQRLPHKRW